MLTDYIINVYDANNKYFGHFLLYNKSKKYIAKLNKVLTKYFDHYEISSKKEKPFESIKGYKKDCFYSSIAKKLFDIDNYAT